MDKNQFAKNLKTARKTKGYTQEKIADELNTSRTNISKYENGQLEPNIETIIKFIEKYKISADYLFKNES